MASLASAIDDIFGGEPESRGVHVWLDTGYPPLNKTLSGAYDGGMPCGRIVELFGAESSGKTAIATAVMIAAQRQGGLALFMDHERSFLKDIAEDNGLDLTKGKFSLQFPDSFEESVTKSIRWMQYIRTNELIKDDAPLVIVFDSLASMVPQSKLAKDVDEQGMNDSLALAKACSAVMPTLSLYAEKYGCLVIFLNQTREKPGVMFGDPTTTPGGKAPKFYASVRVQVSRSMIKKDGDVIGQTVKCKSIKNKVHRPFLECEWEFLFREDGTGYFDVVGGTIDHLCSIGVLSKGGAYITWTNGKKYHKAKLVELIASDEAYKKELFDLLP